MIMGMTLEEALPFIAAAVLGLLTIVFLMGGGSSPKKFLDPKVRHQ